MDLSENLRRLRLEKGWSQQALAEALLISPKTVSKWETAENRPDIDTVIRLARIFDVTTDTLLLGPSDAPPVDTARLFSVLSGLLSPEALTAASGAPEAKVREVLETGELPKWDSSPAVKTLAKILITLTDTLPRFSRNETLLVQTLCAKLRENDISENAIERFALLYPGALRGYTDGGAPLSAEERVRLIITLFLLDSALNHEDAFPWD